LRTHSYAMETRIARPHGPVCVRSATARGFSLPEVLVVIAIFGILAGIAMSQSDSKRLKISTARVQLIAQLRLARMKAITSVSHCSISFASSTQFKVFPMTYNGTTWQLATTPTNTVNLPSSTSFPTSVVGTRIEFNSRGILVSSTTVTQVNLTDTFGQTKSLQVWPSGQVNAL
jgi:prepilin-type N-terminal cleavage/methylation domain-containing protein